MASPARASRSKTMPPLTKLPRLSKPAEAFLRNHPNQASKLIAAVLEAAAAQETPAKLPIPDNLKRFVVTPDVQPDILSISEAAQRLKISRTTAYDWIEKKRMIGWKTTKAGAAIPAEQIVGSGELVPGIADVLKVIDDPRVTWRFLNEESAFLDTPARPIDKLKQGQIKEVLLAAESYGEAFS